MSSTQGRIGLVGTVFTIGFVVLAVHLWFLMVDQQDTWARRSYENRWSFRAVPSQRGALLDRHGRLLAYDEPTTELALHYQRFRQFHPVGAAVHGANALAALDPARSGTTFDYGDGVLGPLSALRELLAMPARLLRPRALEKHQAAELATTVTTVLAHATGLPRKTVYAALRAAAQGNDTTAVGDAMPVSRERLLAAGDAHWFALRELDAELQRLELERRESLGRTGDPPPGLLATLENMRRSSLAKERTRWVEDGEPREGSLLESLLRTFAEHVPFDLAARLRVQAERHPGLEVLPMVARRVTVAEGSSVRAMLGRVQALDRALPSETWLERQERELPDDWLGELVPEGLVDAELREDLQAEAAHRYRREMLLRERRGILGAEAQFDDVLRGRLGLRFVEHDGNRREQRQWSHLQVAPGEDVRLSLDVALQALAERAADATFRRERERFGDLASQERCEAALCVLDARTGDVLAYAGAPVLSEYPAKLPGIVWRGNGAIGSVVKPLVLAEQLQAMAAGRPHRALTELAPCTGRHTFSYGGRQLSCDKPHGHAGSDPVVAIADSCNSFFFQVGLGLGEDGLARALRRFGLLEDVPGGTFADCWQPRVGGLAVARPKLDRKPGSAAFHTPLPTRAIGYGIQASPVDVARAYAALATGVLPTVSLRTGERRPVVLLDDLVGELEVVRDGLRACVTEGTARRLQVLQELQVAGKTGTAQIDDETGENNAWFAGFLPDAGTQGVQLVLCGVVYHVADKRHGGDAAGRMIADFLADLRADAGLAAAYLPYGGGR